ncbi:unnamed protein product [Phyllotreta striolata]|uniref:Uncharacterized protein n=1 Tax=Phyllotreta striolata TaxID=444603 RepID=A0A9N9TKC4_PHYSR|nr:unnamed protein product [Phyllotreta striolata]
MSKLIALAFLFACLAGKSMEIGENSRRNDTETSKSLSRRRRYLTFPSGSSLQLVYCLTVPSVGVGGIFTIGITAALAWELPSDPQQIFQIFGKKRITSTTQAPETTLPPHEDHHHRISNKGYSNVGQELKRKKYPFKTYYDPFLLKGHFKQPAGWKVRFTPASRENNNFNREDSSFIHPEFHHVHRRTRRELYGKLEKLLTALSKDGKNCLKKAICEVSRVPKGKGTLFQELMKTVFRIKPHDDYPDEDDYDRASNANHDCHEMYASCKHSVWSDMF